jgi:hypothetical protein
MLTISRAEALSRTLGLRVSVKNPPWMPVSARMTDFPFGYNMRGSKASTREQIGRKTFSPGYFASSVFCDCAGGVAIWRDRRNAIQPNNPTPTIKLPQSANFR